MDSRLTKYQSRKAASQAKKQSIYLDILTQAKETLCKIKLLKLPFPFVALINKGMQTSFMAKFAFETANIYGPPSVLWSEEENNYYIGHNFDEQIEVLR